MIKTTISLFILGISFGSGPCIASCGPIIISYIAGTKKDILKALMAYILFSLTRVSVYIFLSLTFYFLGRLVVGSFMSGFSKLVAIAGGTFIILVGILMVLGRRLEIRPCRFLEKNIIERDKKSIIILGLVTGLLPCAPLLAILSYVALISRSWPATLLYGLSFGIGTFLSPLILLVVLAGLIPKFLICKKAIFSRIFSYACGLIFIFLGLQLMVKAF